MNARQRFIAGYLECALWAESANTDDSDDRSIGTVAELADETKSVMEQEAGAFFDAHETILTETELIRPKLCAVEEYAGHDFWLTRNGHGCGFWDGDWPEPTASTLDEASKAAGGRDLYIGDDGLIYQMEG